MNHFSEGIFRPIDIPGEVEEVRPDVKDILDEFVRSFKPDQLTENLKEKLIESDLWNTNSGCWDDDYDILGYQPPCPACHHPMKFNDAVDMLQCPKCGYYVEGSDYPYTNMPSWDEISESDYEE